MKNKWYFLIVCVLFTQAIANDHILGKFDGPIKDVAIGRVYYLERQSKFNEQKCYVESLLTITHFEDVEEKIIKPVLYRLTTPSGGVIMAQSFHTSFPENLDDYADKNTVYKMKLIPNSSKPGTPHKGTHEDGTPYEIPKNWIFQISKANDEKTENPKERKTIYIEKYDNLKESIEKCIAKRLESARSGGGGGSGDGIKVTEKSDLQGQIRKTFQNYNGVKHSSKGSEEDSRLFDNLIDTIDQNLKHCLSFDSDYPSAIIKKLHAPANDYVVSRKKRSELVLKRNDLVKTLSENAATKTKNEASLLQLYAIDLDIMGQEAVIDSIGGSSLFTQDNEDALAASTSAMISKQKILDVTKKLIKELTSKNEDVLNHLNSCTEGYSQASKIAKDGCDRIVVIENCNEDGECTREEKNEPVANSCEVYKDLSLILGNDLKKMNEQIQSKELMSSKKLGQNYLGWKNNIVNTAKNASDVSDREYNWGAPLKKCTEIMFQNVTMSQGLTCSSPPLLKKADDRIGYVNLQIELLKELNELLDKALGYDQSLVDQMLNQREKKIKYLKDSYDNFSTQKEALLK